MNEGGLNNGPGPIAGGRYAMVNEGRLNDGRGQMIMEGPQCEIDMMVDDGPDQAPMNELTEAAPLRGTYSTRTVVIEPMHHGYVVKLDCHRFAFETYERVLECVGEYLKDPSATEEK